MSAGRTQSAPESGQRHRRPGIGSVKEIHVAYWIAIAVVTGAAIWIRARHLNGPMRFDEAFTTFTYANKPLTAIVVDYSTPNNHVFHTLLVNVAIRLGNGIDPWIVRMPAFLAGIVMVPLALVVFSRLAGRAAGLLSAILVAGSSLLVSYSVNARGYTIAGVLILLALGLVHEIRRTPGDHLPWTLLATTGLVGALGLWTIPVFLYPWAAVLVWILAPGGTARRLRRRSLDFVVGGAVSAVGSGVLYAPILLNQGLEATVSNPFVVAPPFPQFLEGLQPYPGEVGSLLIHNVPTAVVLVLIAGLGVSLWAPGAGSLRSLGWSTLGGVTVALFAYHSLPPARVWTSVLPVLFGLAASGIVVAAKGFVAKQASSDWLALAAAATLLVVLMASIPSDHGALSGEGDWFPDAERITLDLGPRLTPDSFVAAAIPASAPLRYYFELHRLPVWVLHTPDTVPAEIYVVTVRDQRIEVALTAFSVDAEPSRVELLSEYPSGTLWNVGFG